MVSEALKSILERKKDVEEALESVRVQLDFLEGRYLESTSAHGNIAHGWDGFLDSKSRSGFVRKEKRYKPKDRLFSYSSYTGHINSGDIFASDKISDSGSQNIATPSLTENGDDAADAASGTSSSTNDIENGRKSGWKKRKGLIDADYEP